MALNKARGNMYPFLNDYPHKGANRGYTINFVKGRCPFQCVYCYYQKNPRYKKKIGELRLDEKELETNLGENNFIFVGSSTDMFADEVPSEWIKMVLLLCRGFSNNKYLFQTKNPKRFFEFITRFPEKTVLGTTIETDRFYNTKAPIPKERIKAMINLKPCGYERMISIEPIISFNLMPFVKAIRDIDTTFISVGADSKNHNLPEPSKEKVLALINELKKFTDVRVKSNLKRLL